VQILKTREAEIVALENTIKESEREASFRALSATTTGRDGAETKDGAGTRGDRESRLSPETIKDFAEIRKSLELVPRNDMAVGMSLNRLDELMR
jgi:hypothetical protein